MDFSSVVSFKSSSSFSRSEASRKKKYEEKIRRKTVRNLAKLERSSSKQKVRKAALAIAAAGGLNNPLSEGSRQRDGAPSSEDARSQQDMSSDDGCSMISAEDAIRRGLRRGTNERNERSGTEFMFRADEFSCYSDVDLATIAETREAPAAYSPPEKKPKGRGKRKKLKMLETLSNELASEAWMCGVCGKAFSTLESADKHEDRHIRQIVASFNWTTGGEMHFLTSPIASVKEGQNTLSLDQSTEATHFQNRPNRQLVELPDGTLAPEPLSPEDERSSNPYFGADDDESLLISNTMKEAIILTDEALENVCKRAEKLILSTAEIQAERELELLSRDKAFYDKIAERHLARTADPVNRYRTEGKTMRSRIQNKFVDAYQLMKEGDPKGLSSDQYKKKRVGQDDSHHAIVHTDQTYYVNVIVKNSYSVVRRELERMAKERWNRDDRKGNKFEQFRSFAHGNLVKLAGLALAADFTPKRIAVQLSNDLYRILKPKVKLLGVDIEVEIEYRVGPYFVLAVNVKTIDWNTLLRVTHKDVAARHTRWLEQSKNADDGEASWFAQKFPTVYHWSKLSKFDILAHIFAGLYSLSWIIYYPICFIWYHSVLGAMIRGFIIGKVMDEALSYVEEKGMDMEIEVKKAKHQAAFMLSALRQLRDEEQKKKQEEVQDSVASDILGPLLGRDYPQDKTEPLMPPDMVMPENLEFIGLEIDLPVGFRRLRWAILSSESEFLKEAVFRVESKYDNISFGSWSKHDDCIGRTDLPDGITYNDFIGAEKHTSYLMPKSIFVSANMCYETNYITTYNDYCFCLKKKASNPDVPYGKTFIAWTQFIVLNTGNNSCRLTCSVEPEYPNGPPLVSRQIKSGMRAGTAEVFLKVGQTVAKYADAYPPKSK